MVAIQSTAAQQRTTASTRGDRDEKLVESLRRAEATAADDLVTTYQNRAYRLAIGITGNAQDAEEVVQDAFWNVVRKIDMFRGESAFGSWLYRIVANGAYMKVRGRRDQRREITLDNVLPIRQEDRRPAPAVVDRAAAVNDNDTYRDTELRLVMSSAVEELPAHFRAALVLRDVKGCSSAEVADALSISVATAKTRVLRARRLIRKRLAELMSVTTSEAFCGLV